MPFPEAWVEVEPAFIVHIFSGVFDSLVVLYTGTVSVEVFLLEGKKNLCHELMYTSFSD